MLPDLLFDVSGDVRRYVAQDAPLLRIGLVDLDRVTHRVDLELVLLIMVVSQVYFVIKMIVFVKLEARGKHVTEI